MKPQLMMLTQDVRRRDGGEFYKAGSLVYVVPSFPMLPVAFYNIVRGPHEGAAVLMSDVVAAAFEARR